MENLDYYKYINNLIDTSINLITFKKLIIFWYV